MGPQNQVMLYTWYCNIGTFCSSSSVFNITTVIIVTNPLGTLCVMTASSFALSVDRPTSHLYTGFVYLYQEHFYRSVLACMIRRDFVVIIRQTSSNMGLF